MKLYFVHLGFNESCDDDDLYYDGKNSGMFISKEAALVYLADALEADKKGELADYCNTLNLHACYIGETDCSEDIPSKEQYEEAFTKLSKELINDVIKIKL